MHGVDLKHIEGTRHLPFGFGIYGSQLSSQTHDRSAFETILLTIEMEFHKVELETKPALLVANRMNLPEDKIHELMSQLQKPKYFQHLFERNITCRPVGDRA